MYLNDEIECAILSVLHQLDEHQKWRRIARYCTYLTNVFWHVSDAVTVPSDRHFPREHDKNKKERRKNQKCAETTKTRQKWMKPIAKRFPIQIYDGI